MIITVNAQRILKILHILAICFWVGGSLSEVLLCFASTTAQNGEEFFGILRSSRFVSVYVVVYLGAFGSFFTGLAYSLCTNRGFFRHKWIIIKWGSTVGLMLLGGFCLGPRAVKMLESAQSLGLAAYTDAAYLALSDKQLGGQAIHLAVLIILIVISVFKPWETGESIRLLNKKLRVEK